MQRILSEVGIYWRTMMDDVHGLDTYIFADSQPNYQFDVRLPYSEPSGLFDGAAESVWDVRTWHNISTGTVVTRDYNYRTAFTDGCDGQRANDAVTTGEHYRYAARIVTRAMFNPETGPNPARSTPGFTERELNRSARIHLFAQRAAHRPGRCWSRGECHYGPEEA
ncbi:contractile injection system protein, VgrG/Pvc8 family [Klebsiella quasipneumoniae]|uniref:contractile injection system protein, VgrG/Pvc8 family n=1 Tax=Klebsiella quasipneumoniae TaxID=1463165 RepID=UPI003B210A7D